MPSDNSSGDIDQQIAQSGTTGYVSQPYYSYQGRKYIASTAYTPASVLAEVRARVLAQRQAAAGFSGAAVARTYYGAGGGGSFWRTTKGKDILKSPDLKNLRETLESYKTYTKKELATLEKFKTFGPAFGGEHNLTPAEWGRGMSIDPSMIVSEWELTAAQPYSKLEGKIQKQMAMVTKNQSLEGAVAAAKRLGRTIHQADLVLGREATLTNKAVLALKRAGSNLQNMIDEYQKKYAGKALGPVQAEIARAELEKIKKTAQQYNKLQKGLYAQQSELGQKAWNYEKTRKQATDLISFEERGYEKYQQALAEWNKKSPVEKMESNPEKYGLVVHKKPLIGLQLAEYASKLPAGFAYGMMKEADIVSKYTKGVEKQIERGGLSRVKKGITTLHSGAPIVSPVTSKSIEQMSSFLPYSLQSVVKTAAQSKSVDIAKTATETFLKYEPKIERGVLLRAADFPKIPTSMVRGAFDMAALTGATPQGLIVFGSTAVKHPAETAVVTGVVAGEMASGTIHKLVSEPIVFGAEALGASILFGGAVSAGKALFANEGAGLRALQAEYNPARLLTTKTGRAVLKRMGYKITYKPYPTSYASSKGVTAVGTEGGMVQLVRTKASAGKPTIIKVVRRGGYNPIVVEERMVGSSEGSLPYLTARRTEYRPVSLLTEKEATISKVDYIAKKQIVSLRSKKGGAVWKLPHIQKYVNKQSFEFKVPVWEKAVEKRVVTIRQQLGVGGATGEVELSYFKPKKASEIGVGPTTAIKIKSSLGSVTWSKSLVRAGGQTNVVFGKIEDATSPLGVYEQLKAEKYVRRVKGGWLYLPEKAKSGYKPKMTPPHRSGFTATEAYGDEFSSQIQQELMSKMQKRELVPVFKKTISGAKKTTGNAVIFTGGLSRKYGPYGYGGEFSSGVTEEVAVPLTTPPGYPGPSLAFEEILHYGKRVSPNRVVKQSFVSGSRRDLWTQGATKIGDNVGKIGAFKLGSLTATTSSLKRNKNRLARSSLETPAREKGLLFTNTRSFELTQNTQPITRTNWGDIIPPIVPPTFDFVPDYITEQGRTNPRPPPPSGGEDKKIGGGFGYDLSRKKGKKKKAKKYGHLIYSLGLGVRPLAPLSAVEAVEAWTGREAVHGINRKIAKAFALELSGKLPTGNVPLILGGRRKTKKPRRSVKNAKRRSKKAVRLF